jgi:hypothetical protein
MTTNYVLYEIHLTSSFNYLLQSATTSNSNLDKKELHQRNYVPMIVKIIGAWYKGQNTIGVGEGEEERTNPYKNYASSPQDFWRGCPKRERNGKNKGRTGQDQALPLFYPS